MDQRMHIFARSFLQMCGDGFLLTGANHQFWVRQLPASLIATDGRLGSQGDYPRSHRKRLLSGAKQKSNVRSLSPANQFHDNDRSSG
jgi:hypothetical protein